MAEFNFTTRQLYNLYFRHVKIPLPLFDTKKEVVIPDASDFDQGVFIEPQELQKSVLGTPLHFPLTVDGYPFPNEPLITVRGSKTIVKTEITQYAGTVKEDMGLNDYKITIQGLIINEEDNGYPEELVSRINRICAKSGSVAVVSPLLTLFNIDLITIEEFDFPPREGFQSVQPYEIQASSDRSVELVLKEADLGF